MAAQNSRGGKVQSCLLASKIILIKNQITVNEKLHILRLHLFHKTYNALIIA